MLVKPPMKRPSLTASSLERNPRSQCWAVAPGSALQKLSLNSLRTDLPVREALLGEEVPALEILPLSLAQQLQRPGA